MTGSSGIPHGRLARDIFPDIGLWTTVRIEITASPTRDDEVFVIDQVRAFNAAFTTRDFRPLCVFARDADNSIVAGLIGKTYWNYLEIHFLWVSEQHRKLGHASAILRSAENEALTRGCEHVFLDTFSFQALGFYQKLGYQEFGRLSGFSGKHDKHYLYKALGPAAGL
jgi:ribosomal protein S18 acetylase RimI-like enzyme